MIATRLFDPFTPAPRAGFGGPYQVSDGTLSVRNRTGDTDLDQINGGSGHDHLPGGAGVDTLPGDQDADVLIGQDGCHIPGGFLGADIFIWNTAGGRIGSFAEDRGMACMPGSASYTDPGFGQDSLALIGTSADLIGADEFHFL